MAKDKPKHPGALETPIDEPETETNPEDPNVETIEAAPGDENAPPIESTEKKDKGVRKIILKGDNPKVLYAVKNTGINDLDVAVAQRAGKPILRRQYCYGKEIKIGPDETIVVSQNLRRFFSAAKGYSVESYKG